MTLTLIKLNQDVLLHVADSTAILWHILCHISSNERVAKSRSKRRDFWF